ncbi:AsmA family protein [Methylobacterium sp. ID0610]|uniref:AsmA family protein n=1 Tax=Methylobacterium carpenticola TaxID=3344827 RepID=UPI003678D7E8
MSRRSILVLCGGASALALAAAACQSWGVATPAARAFVGRHLARAYGLAFEAEGPTTLALLPAPRLRFRGVRVLNDGRLLAESRELEVQLGLGALLAGQAEAAALTLGDARFVLPEGEGDDRWAGPLARLTARLAEGARPLRRLAVTGGRIAVGEAGPDRVSDLAVAASWPRAGAGLDLSGRFSWRGVPATIVLAAARPLDLATGNPSPLKAAFGWPSGSLDLDGTGSWRDGPLLAGQGRFTTRALPETLAWLGVRAPLAPVLGRATLEGRFEARPDEFAMPALRLAVADTVLDGAGGATLGPDGRLALSGTLATERLDLSTLLPGRSDPDWVRAPLALAPWTGGDLDLRLSAASARIGSLEAEDVAAGLLVRAGAVEASLGRATVQGGTVKGRAVLLDGGSSGLEAKLQGTADRVDLGALLADLGLSRPVLGRLHGSLALDAAGSDLAEMTRRVGGRLAATIDQGEIAGVALAEVPGAEPVLRRGSRLSFERAQLTLGVAGGLGEIMQGQVRTGASALTLRGRVNLPEQRLAAEIEPVSRDPLRGAERRGEARSLYELAGPWAALRLRPLSPSRPPGLPTAASAYAP